MITEEQIKAAVKDIASVPIALSEEERQNFRQLVYNAINWTIEQMEPEWIPVTEGFPETNRSEDMIKVLGWDGVQILKVDYYQYEDDTLGRFRVSCLKCFNDVTETITHWMPLPEPPKTV